MKKKSVFHLPLDKVYKDYDLMPGTELIYLNLPDKFKIRPKMIEVEGEYKHYVLVRVYFGDDDQEISKEYSYLTTLHKFELYHEFRNENLYICRNYKEENIYV